MSKPLRVLIVEDSEDDSLLLLRELGNGEYDPVWERVDTAGAMSVALEEGSWDLVLSDFDMPRFSALAALNLVQQAGLDLPFIVVSGVIGEVQAVRMMKAGAHDYVFKNNLARLLPVIERELNEATVRRQRKRAEEALREARDNLETRVQERTTELREANQALQAEIAERKRAEGARASLETQLRQAQRLEAIGTLAGGIAHDFNNILTPIMGYAELAKNELPEGAPGKKEFQEIFKASKRASDLVRQILTFSRQAEDDLTPIEIAAIVSEALELIRSSLPATIEIRRDIRRDCVDILANPAQIHQLVLNLCTNAYQAMAPSGGVLEVSLTPVAVDSELERKHGGLHEGLYVRLTVRDTGAGIDPAARARIFDPFFTTKAPGKGTGLGLAIVHGIVTGSGGAITVRSEPGTGTSFHLYFPRPESKVHRQPEAVEGLLNGKERILLVDDEDMLLEVSRRMLESLGYEVMCRFSQNGRADAPR